jgi:hypothetical protein
MFSGVAGHALAGFVVVELDQPDVAADNVADDLDPLAKGERIGAREVA